MAYRRTTLMGKPPIGDYSSSYPVIKKWYVYCGGEFRVHSIGYHVIRVIFGPFRAGEELRRGFISIVWKFRTVRIRKKSIKEFNF